MCVYLREGLPTGHFFFLMKFKSRIVQKGVGRHIYFLVILHYEFEIYENQEGVVTELHSLNLC